MPNCTYMTLAEFKNTTGMTIDDTIILQALSVATQEMQRKVLIPQAYQTQSPRDTHKLQYINPSPPSAIYTMVYGMGDINADLKIDKEDVNAFEIDSNFAVTDRNANITSVDGKYGIVKFDTDLPTTNKSLVIEYFTAIAPIDRISSLYKELCQKIAVNYLFSNIPFKKLQCGISSWTINGVNVTFDLNAMQSVMEANRARIKELFHDLTPIMTRVTRIRHPSIDPMKAFYNSITRTGGYWWQ